MDITVLAAFVGFFAMVLTWMVAPQRTLTPGPSPCAQGEGSADADMLLHPRAIPS